MSDLIEREDAIKALYKYGFVSKDVIEREIKAIPSVDRPNAVDLSSVYSTAYKSGYEKGEADEKRWWSEYCAKCTDADRPQGKWIEHKERTIVRNGNFVDYFPTEYECSNCGLRRVTYFIDSPLSNYCPNCGARMKGADDDNA